MSDTCLIEAAINNLLFLNEKNQFQGNSYKIVNNQFISSDDDNFDTIYSLSELEYPIYFTVHQILNHVIKMKLPSKLNNYFSKKNLNSILNFMVKDKKNISKRINLILIKRIGSTVINNDYQKIKIKKFLKKELTN